MKQTASTEWRLRRMVVSAFALLSAAGAEAPAPPQSAALVRETVAETLDRQDSAALTRGLLQLSVMGAGLSDEALNRVEPAIDEAGVLANLRPPMHRADLIASLRRNRSLSAQDQNVPVVVTIPESYRLVEGIALRNVRAGQRVRLFAGTVEEGRLATIELERTAAGWSAVPGTAWRDIPIDGPAGSLFGMAIDQRRQLLWIATASVPQTRVDRARMAGLIAVDTNSLRVVRRVPLPAGSVGIPGDVVVSQGGTVYVSSSSDGTIWRCQYGCQQLEVLVPPGRLTSAQGMALSAGDNGLTVADYRAGLFHLSLSNGAISPVQVPYPMMLDGIDGLVRLDASRLIAIQNGTNPRRIMMIRLSRDGRRVVEAEEMLRLSPNGPEPTLGVLACDFAGRGSHRLLFIGDSQWERYGRDGAPRADAPARATPIHSIDYAYPIIVAG